MMEDQDDPSDPSESEGQQLINTGSDEREKCRNRRFVLKGRSFNGLVTSAWLNMFVYYLDDRKFENPRDFRIVCPRYTDVSVVNAWRATVTSFTTQKDFIKGIKSKIRNEKRPFSAQKKNL